jgi:hypothetical protein
MVPEASSILGLLGLLVLVVNVYALYHVFQSGAGPWTKLAWVLIILFLPGLGLLIWVLAGPRRYPEVR